MIAQGVSPSEVMFDGGSAKESLFGFDDDGPSVEVTPRESLAFNVPKAYSELAPKVAAHRDPARWELLYRALFRIVRGGEPHLMELITDDDVIAMTRMEKAVRRDVHKMKAFVRFRRVDDERGEHFIAWHRPDHYIVPLAGPFFARRFKGMRWTILTPDASATWDGQTLSYGDGARVGDAPSGDQLEDWWRTYYANIFNPARVKIAAMKAELPVRHWPTLPESELIPELIQNANPRVEEMIRKAEGFEDTAAAFLPEAGGLKVLGEAAEACTACDLHKMASQVVFGRGPADARLMLVGEQPGDREDRAGEPFVGPAGRLLDGVLEEAGVSRDEVYITNVVKHFKFVPRGGRRIHQKPNAREIFACRPWLEAELDRVKPETLICLGATAAQALLGRDFRITKSRGEVIQSEWCDATMATWHPAAVLRMPDQSRREEMRQEMIADIGSVA